MKSCYFAGYGKAKITAYIDSVTDRELQRLISKGVTRFYTVGEQGFDMLCAMKVLELKKSAPQLELHMLTACPPQMFCGERSEEEQVVYNILLHCADSTHQLDFGCRSDCQERLGRYLAECCDYCLSFGACDTVPQWVQLAENAGVSIVDIK